MVAPHTLLMRWFFADFTQVLIGIAWRLCAQTHERAAVGQLGLQGLLSNDQ